MMNVIFYEQISKAVVVVYLDNVYVFTKSLEDHRKEVHQALKILKDHNIFCKPEKCLFEVKKLQVLGTIIGQGKAEMDPVKVKGVKDWPAPKNVKELQSFIGFANFYRRFIKDFSLIAKPLHDLTKKDAKWNWQGEQQQAFEQLRDSFCNEPILLLPNLSKPFKLETDASDFAVGAVLSQQDEENRWKPVAYFS